MLIEIPQSVLNGNLSLGAKLVYGVAMANPDEENYLLAAKLNVSDKQLNRYILEIDKAGLITRTRGKIHIVDAATRKKAQQELELLQSQVKIFKDDRFLGKK